MGNKMRRETQRGSAMDARKPADKSRVKMRWRAAEGVNWRAERYVTVLVCLRKQ